MEETFIFSPENYGFFIFSHVNLEDELWVSKKQDKESQGFIIIRFYKNSNKWGIFRDDERIYFGKIESDNLIKSLLLEDGVLKIKNKKLK